MREKAVKALVAGNANDLPDVLTMGKEADRVYWLVVRQLLSAVDDPKLAEALGIRSRCWLLGDRAVLTNLKAVVNRTEKIAKETSKLLQLGFCLESEALDDISQLDAAIVDVSEGAIGALMTLDIARGNQVIENIKSMEEAANRIMDRLSETVKATDCRSSIFRLVHAFNEIAARYETIAEIAINRALEQSGDYANIDIGFLDKR